TDNNKEQFAEIFHAHQGIAAQPNEVEWYNYRGWAHGELGQWDQCRADHARAMELSPDQSKFWHRYAIAYLGAGDLAGYHTACARMLRHFAEKPWEATACLYACLPDPNPGEHAEQLVSMAEATVKATPESAGRSRGAILRAYGAALYRAGQN